MEEGEKNKILKDTIYYIIQGHLRNLLKKNIFEIYKFKLEFNQINNPK